MPYRNCTAHWSRNSAAAAGVDIIVKLNEQQNSEACFSLEYPDENKQPFYSSGLIVIYCFHCYYKRSTIRFVFYFAHYAS